MPVIENNCKLGGETYHNIERVNAIEKGRWWSSKIESILMWLGYEPGKGLGPKLQGITEPIRPQYHGTTFGLRYEYNMQEYQDWTPLWHDSYYPLEQPIPPLHQTFRQTDVIWESEEDKVLADMRKLFLHEEDIDCSAILEEEEEDPTIQRVREGAALKNWTAASSRARRVPGIIITYPDEPTTVTCNETTRHKKSDSKDLEDDIIPKEIVKEVENFENKPKSNLEETEAVNLADSETIKETRISIHLSPSEKVEYTRISPDLDGRSGRLKKNLHHAMGIYCYKMMPFDLKNSGATYMRAMTTLFHDMIHKEIELNHEKCPFGVSAKKLLDLIISRRGTELDPSKIKAIQDLPPPKNQDVMSFLGCLNYISRFMAHSIVIYEPIFKMLKKYDATSWTEECQKAFDKIKEYFSKSLVLVPPEPGRSLLLYLSMLDGAFGCILGQHDETGRKEQAIYYLSKKFTPYEAQFILVAIYYLTKWVEVASYKAVTKKVEVDFVRDRIVCRLGVPESIITDNAANLYSDMIRAMCETFKIKHQNSTAYRPQMNGAVIAANKNIKKILRKMVDNYKQWHEKLPFAFLGYRTTVRMSTEATPYLLVYGTEAIIPVEVEIPSLRIIQEAEFSIAEWIQSLFEQMYLIDGKRMNAVCHG
ncbi:uncharacterized protein [Nicotiana tomentosiformis]|uniref:uncharacterized protein n=1 Tax=Nicotiana tomentosiformis TaxID=4098 RepID=UPI00388CAB5C